MPEHWEKAIGGNTGGNICANPQQSTGVLAHKKTGNLPPEGDGFPVIWSLAPPRGLEEVIKTLENSLKTNSGGNGGGTICDELAAQLSDWCSIYEQAALVCRRLTKAAER